MYFFHSFLLHTKIIFGMPNLDACVQMDSIPFCVLCWGDVVVVWHFSFLDFIDFVVFRFFEERKRM